MTHDAIRETLRASTEAAPPVQVDEVVRRVMRRRRRGRAIGTLVALVVASSVVIAVSLLRGTEDSGVVVVADTTEALTPTEPATGGPVSIAPATGSLQIVVGSATVGPLHVTTGEARPAQYGWMEHELILRNDGTRRVYLNDTRFAEVLGAPGMLVVAEDGCGYSLDRAQHLSTGCRGVFSPLALDPGGSTTLVFTTWRDLPGLAPLEPGRFVLERTVQFRTDRPFDGPADAAAPDVISSAVQITYTVGQAPG